MSFLLDFFHRSKKETRKRAEQSSNATPPPPPYLGTVARPLLSLHELLARLRGEVLAASPAAAALARKVGDGPGLRGEDRELRGVRRLLVEEAQGLVEHGSDVR